MRDMELCLAEPLSDDKRVMQVPCWSADVTCYSGTGFRRLNFVVPDMVSIMATWRQFADKYKTLCQRKVQSAKAALLQNGFPQVAQTIVYKM